MEISKRLQTIASYVPAGTHIVADIGTDHGYVPIYLITNKMAAQCIACDVNPMPLRSARENISSYNLEDKIQTRLGSGLSTLTIGEPDVIIIAGMGGMLIIDILRDNPELVKAVGLLILQPQLDVSEVRKYIHSIQFTIIEEEMIYEDGKYYTIIVAKPGVEEAYSEVGYLFGEKTMEKKDLIFKEFIIKQIGKLETVESNLSKANTCNSQKRLNEVKLELKKYKEVFECLYK